MERRRKDTYTPDTGAVLVCYTIEHLTGRPRPGPCRAGSAGGKYAAVPTALAKGAGEGAKFRMNKHTSAFLWVVSLAQNSQCDWKVTGARSGREGD